MWGSGVSHSCAEIILDTSAIIFAVEKRVNLLELALSVPEEVCKVIIPSPVVEELKALARGRGVRSRAARAALKIIEKEKVEHSSVLEIIDTGDLRAPVDDLVLLLAKEGQRVVVTADRKMRRKADVLGIRVYLVAKASLNAR